MINLAEQFTMMTCVEHINQKKMNLNDTHSNHARDVKTITSQNDQN